MSTSITRGRLPPDAAAGHSFLVAPYGRRPRSRHLDARGVGRVARQRPEITPVAGQHRRPACVVGERDHDGVDRRGDLDTTDRSPQLRRRASQPLIGRADVAGAQDPVLVNVAPTVAGQGLGEDDGRYQRRPLAPPPQLFEPARWRASMVSPPESSTSVMPCVSRAVVPTAAVPISVPPPARPRWWARARPPAPPRRHRVR